MQDSTDATGLFGGGTMPLTLRAKDRNDSQRDELRRAPVAFHHVRGAVPADRVLPPADTVAVRRTVRQVTDQTLAQMQFAPRQTRSDASEWVGTSSSGLGAGSTQGRSSAARKRLSVERCGKWLRPNKAMNGAANGRRHS